VVASRIYLSAPHLAGDELAFVQEAFATNWVAPVGPHIDAFEREFAQLTGCGHAVAVSSGSAALHLALLLAGVGRGDDVLVSSFTFAASANPVVYTGARPVFVDSERVSWNIDPDLVADYVHGAARSGKLPKAIVATHIYGQAADLDRLQEICEWYDITLIEDAAESLGSTYKGRHPGTFGMAGAFSFNGNKIITTSGGGMLVTPDAKLAARARKLATQAREPVPHYEHTEIGFNYRLSNVLAGIGRGQLRVLEDRVQARRANFAFYAETLGALPGIGLMPEAPWGRHTRWLSCITIDPSEFGADRETVRLALEAQGIESRALWKPMHLQPIFEGQEMLGGDVAAGLFTHGLSLPSGSNLSRRDLERVVDVVYSCARRSPLSALRAGSESLNHAAD
jgi:pyridoxal phosphate-dependent aminotransferase EpsN